MAESETKNRETVEKHREKVQKAPQSQSPGFDCEQSIPFIAEKMLNLQQTYGNKYVQRLAEGTKNASLDGDIVGRIEAQRGSGKPLEPGVGSRMEASFGQDLGDVRLHTGAEADRLSKELGASAFTSGKDIFFREGAYSPGTESGKCLIKHELTHTIQQNKAGLAAPLKISDPEDLAEIEAKNSEQAAEPAAVSGSFAAASIMRKITIGPVTSEVAEATTGQNMIIGPITSEVAEAPAEGTEATTEQQTPIRALWEESVVRRVQSATEGLSAGPGELPDRAQRSMDILNDASNTVGELIERYGSNSDVWNILVGACNVIGDMSNSLRPYTNWRPPPIEVTQEGLNRGLDSVREDGNRL